MATMQRRTYMGVTSCANTTGANRRSKDGRLHGEAPLSESPNRFFTPTPHKYRTNAERQIGHKPTRHDVKQRAISKRAPPQDVVHWNKALSRTTLKPGRKMTDFMHDFGLLNKMVPFKSDVKMIRDDVDSASYLPSKSSSYFEYSGHLLTQISKYKSVLYNPMVCVRHVGTFLWNSFWLYALSSNISYFTKFKLWSVPVKRKPLTSEYVSVSAKYWHVDPPIVPWNILQYKTEGEDNFPTVIGRGTFSEVVAATINFNGKCTDIVLKEFYSDISTKDQIFDEAKITIYLKPTGCVPICYGLIAGQHGISGIALEMYGNGITLDHILDEHDLHPSDWFSMAHQLAESLCKIHEMNILINDIKSDNVLVDLHGPTIKYCDFGCASYRTGIVFCSEGMNRFLHLSPEVRTGSLTTKANDVFGLGRLLQKISNISGLTNLSPTYHRCMNHDPERRITAETAAAMLGDAAKAFDDSVEASPDQRRSDWCPRIFSTGYFSDARVSGDFNM